MLTAYLVPIAIISSALIGFFAAYLTGFINRNRIEISDRINELCKTLDLIKELSVKYWMEDNVDYIKSKVLEAQIIAHFHGLGMQIAYLDEILRAFKESWWRHEEKSARLKNINEIFSASQELHEIVTGGSFGQKNRMVPDIENGQRIMTKLEKFKMLIRFNRRKF